MNSSTTVLYQTLGKELGWTRETQDQGWRPGYPNRPPPPGERLTGRKQVEIERGVVRGNDRWVPEGRGAGELGGKGEGIRKYRLAVTK